MLRGCMFLRCPLWRQKFALSYEQMFALQYISMVVLDLHTQNTAQLTHTCKCRTPKRNLAAENATAELRF
jgi:hypothetical protein